MDRKMHNGRVILRLSVQYSTIINTHERGKGAAGCLTHLPDVEHLLVVTQESASPYQALTVYTWVSCADFFYFALDIVNSSNRGDRNLKRVRISGELDADEQRHEMKGQSDDGAGVTLNAEDVDKGVT
jgi:hypothetical protein